MPNTLRYNIAYVNFTENIVDAFTNTFSCVKSNNCIFLFDGSLTSNILYSLSSVSVGDVKILSSIWNKNNVDDDLIPVLILLKIRWDLAKHIIIIINSSIKIHDLFIFYMKIMTAS